MAEYQLRGRLSSAQKSLFTSSAQLTAGNGGGRLLAPFREMTIGKEMHPSEHYLKKHSGKGVSTKWFNDLRQLESPSGLKMTANGKTRESWSAQKDGVIKLANINELYRLNLLIAHQFPIALANWRNVLAYRAQAVFKQSFTMKKFNSDGEVRWKSISSWTVKKRKKKGYWPNANRLLQETNKLYKSIEVETGTTGAKVVAKAPYAGIHNDPEPGMTYGNGFGYKYHHLKPVTKRQFMGHSTEIDKFIGEYEKNYLFYTLFRGPVAVAK